MFNFIDDSTNFVIKKLENEGETARANVMLSKKGNLEQKLRSLSKINTLNIERHNGGASLVIPQMPSRDKPTPSKHRKSFEIDCTE